MIEKLGVICLVVTDIDSTNDGTKCQPELNKEFKTNNDTLKTWHPQKESLYELLCLNEEDMVKTDSPVRVAYQRKIDIDGESIYPYTFEDAMVLENLETFKAITSSTGLLKKMVEASKLSLKDAAKKAFEEINSKGAKKAEFALDILYFEDPSKIKPPLYIKNGLQWVADQLTKDKQGLKIS